MSLEDLKNNLVLLNSFDFGNDFIVGISSLTELSTNKINQIYSSSNSTVSKNEDASFYKTELEKYKKDISLIKQSGIPNFRFSLSWSKILPDGIGKINEKAIEFYQAILDTCIENGIEPFVTLYDSNLPIELQKKGGWSNREILNWFENYVEICVTTFTTKVKYWIIFNEPSIGTGAYDFLGLSTIGKDKMTVFLSVVHHTLLSQSIGFKTIKKTASNAQVGSFFSCNYSVPLSFTINEVRATERVDALLNRLYIEPTLGLGYPMETLPFLKRISKFMLPEDSELIKIDFDFIGIQNYTREIVTYNSYRPYLNAKILQYDKIRGNKNHLGMELYNELIYLIVNKYSEYEGIKKIFITDNLTQIEETKDLNSIIGYKKTNDYTSFLYQIQKANRNGGKVFGLFSFPVDQV